MHAKMMPKRHEVAVRPRAGYTLLEVLAVVVILGVVGALAVLKFSATLPTARKNSCYVNKGDIEVQAQLWYRNQGAWPATNLSDIGANTGYFPTGLPVCPVDGTAYTLDATTHKVTGHTH